MSFKIIFITSAIWLLTCTLYIYIRETIEIQFVMKPKDGSYITTNNPHSMESNEIVSHSSSSTSSTSKSNHRQPRWAYKFNFVEPQVESIPMNERICYVHVGKTAGSTLACYLGFNYDHCYTGTNATSSINIPAGGNYNDTIKDTILNMIPMPSLLPHLTTSMLHRQYDSCSEDHAASMYLFVVRNPLDRIKSWFEYERPDNITSSTDSYSYQIKKPLFIDCKYSTMNILGGPTGLGGYNSTLCTRRAFRAIAGIVGYSSHNYYNYEYYYNRVLLNHKRSGESTSSKPRIIVVRTEHLEIDWDSIETTVLRGTPLPGTNYSFVHKNRSPKRLEDLLLEDTSRLNICAALCQEIQIYKKILYQAENINREQFIQSLNELASSCPIEAATTKCINQFFHE